MTFSGARALVDSIATDEGKQNMDSIVKDMNNELIKAKQPKSKNVQPAKSQASESLHKRK